MRFKVRKRWFVIAAGLLLVWCFMFIPGAGEWYVRNVYPLLFSVLSHFSSWFPFSVGDIFIYGSITGLVFYLLYSLIRRWHIIRTLRHIVEFLVVVYIWFYLAWGLTYFRQDFFTRTHISPVPYTEADFHTFLSAYTDSLNISWLPVEEVDWVRTASEVKKGYRSLDSHFGLIRPQDYLRGKPMLISSLMSSVGVKGYMGPFFTEFNLNRELLPVEFPSTYAHEMAHVLGISNEAEANLYSFLVCSGSDIPEVRFAGYFSLLPYVLSNTYSVLSEEEFTEWKKSLRPEIRELYNQRVEHWYSRYNPFIGKVQSIIYNSYLKGNRISSGTGNYSEVIGLLIALESQKK